MESSSANLQKICEHLSLAAQLLLDISLMPDVPPHGDTQSKPG